MGEKLANPWVPHEAVHVLAGEVGASVDGVPHLAVRAKLAVAKLVKFTDIFQGCHFQLIFLELALE